MDAYPLYLDFLQICFLKISSLHSWITEKTLLENTVITVVILRTCCIHLQQFCDLQHELSFHNNTTHPFSAFVNFCGCATELKTWKENKLLVPSQCRKYQLLSPAYLSGCHSSTILQLYKFGIFPKGREIQWVCAQNSPFSSVWHSLSVSMCHWGLFETASFCFIFPAWREVHFLQFGRG